MAAHLLPAGFSLFPVLSIKSAVGMKTPFVFRDSSRFCAFCVVPRLPACCQTAPAADRSRARPGNVTVVHSDPRKLLGNPQSLRCSSLQGLRSGRLRPAGLGQSHLRSRCLPSTLASSPRVSAAAQRLFLPLTLLPLLPSSCLLQFFARVSFFKKITSFPLFSLNW